MKSSLRNVDLNAALSEPKKTHLNKSAVPYRRLLRTKEAAEYLGISPWKLRRLIQSGQLPVVQDGDDSPFLLDMRDLDSYIERNKRLVAS